MNQFSVDTGGIERICDTCQVATRTKATKEWKCRKCHRRYFVPEEERAALRERFIFREGTNTPKVSRETILAYLKQKGPVSRQQLGEALYTPSVLKSWESFSPSLKRRRATNWAKGQINRLLKAGLVEEVRPLQVWRIREGVTVNDAGEVLG